MQVNRSESGTSARRMSKDSVGQLDLGPAPVLRYDLRRPEFVVSDPTRRGIREAANGHTTGRVVIRDCVPRRVAG
jgi:hypothetical protein